MIVSLEEVVERYNQLQNENKELKRMLKQQSDGFELKHTRHPFEPDKDELYVKDNNTRIRLKNGDLWITVFIPQSNEIMSFNYHAAIKTIMKEYLDLEGELNNNEKPIEKILEHLRKNTNTATMDMALMEIRKTGGHERMTEEITLDYSTSHIKLNGECLNCALRRDIDDGMNITSYCIFDDMSVDKLTSKCHLTEEDQKEINGRILVEKCYIL